jgi:hypothetical protein
MMKPYEPPKGMADLVRVLQACAPADAVELLALAFLDCANNAILQDIRLRIAAPELLAACKLALDIIEKGRTLDALMAAVDKAECSDASTTGRTH